MSTPTQRAAEAPVPPAQLAVVASPPIPPAWLGVAPAVAPMPVWAQPAPVQPAPAPVAPVAPVPPAPIQQTAPSTPIQPTPVQLGPPLAQAQHAAAPVHATPAPVAPVVPAQAAVAQAPVAPAPVAPPQPAAPPGYGQPGYPGGPYAQPVYGPPMSAQPYAPAGYPPMSAPPMSAPPTYGAAQYGQPMSGVPYGPSLYGQPMSAPPGYAYYGYPWAPPPVPVRPVASRPVRILTAALSALLFVSVLGVGLLYGYAKHEGLLGQSATWRTAGSGPAAPTVLPPAQDAPATEWSSWARKNVIDGIQAQAGALLAGNQAGYVGFADPTNKNLVADLTRRFAALRAMGPGIWQQALTGGLTATGDRSWSADIKISYCFGDANCRTSTLVEEGFWEYKSDRLMMTKLVPAGPDQNGPRPWESDTLVVAKGTRVIIAATKDNQWRLADAVKSADKAALVADTFSKWEPTPNRYLIFLAGPDDWKRWYGSDQPDWAAAWTVPVSSTVSEVVVRTEVVQQRGLQTLLTHELTHVTSLAGKRDGATRSAWWLIEGIAEYATMVGQPVRGYEGIAATRDYVKAKWDGHPDVSPPSADAPLAEATARYGIAFLSVRRIADTYGQDKMLDFWGKIVHDNDTFEVAAQRALGTSWAAVSADCASFVRSSTH